MYRQIPFRHWLESQFGITIQYGGEHTFLYKRSNIITSKNPLPLQFPYLNPPFSITRVLWESTRISDYENLSFQTESELNI